MASTFSSDLSLELVATGEKAGLWELLQILIYNYYKQQHPVM